MNVPVINERIKILIEGLNLTNRSFAIKLGINPSIIHNIVAGRKSTPSFSVLEKMVLTFSAIDTKWLLTGQGTLYIDSSPQPTLIGEQAPEYGHTAKEAALEKEIINLKGQIEAYKNVITSLSTSISFSKETDK